MTSHDSQTRQDPCATCAIDQDCCARLDGLTVSHAEYDRHFAAHAAVLDVEERGATRVVSARGQPCPNWAGGCTVYETRPMECRLFPHSLRATFETPASVTLAVHDRTRCPAKSALLAPRPVSHALVAEWAKETWPGRRVRVFFDRGAGRLETFARRVGRKLS